jgi:WD40 repeat protein
VAGCADGSLTRWDLARPSDPVKLKAVHRGPVTALAFSPDGAYVASGGEDYAIVLSKVASGEVLYPFDCEHGVDDPHQGTITALHFTPQCQLVSAARDNTLRVWDLHQRGAKLAFAPIANRNGSVAQLGASADGRYMLFDKGKTLQLVTVADGRTVCALDNLGGSNFDTLALFSTDGALMLTGGAGEGGRLHLWKSPAPGERAYQVRELVTKDRAAITSAAFGPANQGFAVTGGKDGNVHVWTLPSEQAVADHRIFADADNQSLRLDLVEQVIEGGKTRVAVNVHNPRDAQGQLRLVPGQRVTLVVLLPSER